MDQLKYQNMVATLTQGLKSQHNLFKLTQLLVSVSVFSFMFSPSSLLVFLHYFKLYFSTIPFQLFTHNIDKNCMFLLCNGLLVFVGITRSFSGSSGGDEQPSKYAEDDSQSQFPDVDENEPMLGEEAKEKTSENDELDTAAEHTIDIKHYAEEVDENLVDEEQEEEEEGSDQSVFKEEEEEEEEEEVDDETELFDAGDEEGEVNEEIYNFLNEENIEEEEEEESAEELNKKFDDFIRRMKEGLRIEAKRQLVMV